MSLLSIFKGDISAQQNNSSYFNNEKIYPSKAYTDNNSTITATNNKYYGIKVNEDHTPEIVDKNYNYSTTTVRKYYQPYNLDTNNFFNSINDLNSLFDGKTQDNMDYYLFNLFIDSYNSEDNIGAKYYNIHKNPPIFPVINYFESIPIDVAEGASSTKYVASPALNRMLYKEGSIISTNININQLNYSEICNTINTGCNACSLEIANGLNGDSFQYYISKFERYLSSISFACISKDQDNLIISYIPHTYNNESRYFNDIKHSKHDVSNSDYSIKVELNSSMVSPLKNSLSLYKQLYNDNGNYDYPCEFNRHTDKNWVGRHVTIINNSNNRFIKLLTPSD